MQFDKAYSFLIQKLENELPKYLYYHNASHTKDVLEYAQLIAASENISEPDLTVLKTAALFHDAGHLEKSNGHEEISCKMAHDILPKYEYSTEQIAHICELIMATKMPQSPNGKLAEILCDADLYYMSTDSYIVKAETLYREMHEMGLIKDRVEWRNIESKFLQDHHYFINSAKNKLGNKVKQNEEHLRENEFRYKQ